MNNFLNNLLEYYKQHSGRIKGAAVGLLTAWAFFILDCLSLFLLHSALYWVII